MYAVHAMRPKYNLNFAKSKCALPLSHRDRQRKCVIDESKNVFYAPQCGLLTVNQRQLSVAYSGDASRLWRLPLKVEK